MTKTMLITKSSNSLVDNTNRIDYLLYCSYPPRLRPMAQSPPDGRGVVMVSGPADASPRGDDNRPHVSTNDPSTFPWGYVHSGAADGHDSTWTRALALGPTNEAKVRSRL